MSTAGSDFLCRLKSTSYTSPTQWLLLLLLPQRPVKEQSWHSSPPPSDQNDVIKETPDLEDLVKESIHGGREARASGRLTRPVSTFSPIKFPRSLELRSVIVETMGNCCGSAGSLAKNDNNKAKPFLHRLRSPPRQ
ncbi:hypothetical protein YC2023_083657 [Brassica napus]